MSKSFNYKSYLSNTTDKVTPKKEVKHCKMKPYKRTKA